MPPAVESSPSNRWQILEQALRMTPLAVLISATLQILSVPGWSATSRPNLHFNGGRLSSFTTTSELTFNESLNGREPFISLLQLENIFFIPSGPKMLSKFLWKRFKRLLEICFVSSTLRCVAAFPMQWVDVRLKNAQQVICICR